MATTERKTRSDSKLDALPKARVAELRDGLLGGWRYDDARAWLQSECKLSCSLGAFTAFYKRHCAPILRDRRQLAALKAETITAGAGTDWDAASMERLRQMVFEFMADPNADIEATERMFKLLLKSRDQEMDARRLRLLEAKAAKLDELEAKAKEIKAGGGLTPETLEMLEKQLKLL
jgi:hypothetical protein